MLSPFRRFRWKLTFSYTLVTVTAVLVLEILAFAFLILLLNVSPLAGSFAQQLAEQVAAQAAPFLDGEPQEQQALETWLSSSFGDQEEQGSSISAVDDSEPGAIEKESVDWVVVTDAQGNILATNLPDLVSDEMKGKPFADPVYLEQSRGVILQAAGGESAGINLQGEVALAAAPIRGTDQQIRGILYMRMRSFFPSISRPFFLSALQLLGASALVFTIGAGAIGALFGFLTARGISRRLYTVSQAADSWSHGNFSAFIRDTSGDELGQLSQGLNRMAEQLQNLLQAREELASLEERNRLARDLHDSVKQQVFATAMQVGAARALIDRDPGAAKARLDEAEQLARQVQSELATIIQELRPARLKGRGLAEALQEYAAGWSRQTKIPVEVRVQGQRPLPLAVEQSLFRVLQEALANIARHSQARQVDIFLAWEGERLKMTVADDGQGFDIKKIAAGGIGLQSMRERIENLGGRLAIESIPMQGTRINVEIKIKDEG